MQTLLLRTSFFFESIISINTLASAETRFCLDPLLRPVHVSSSAAARDANPHLDFKSRFFPFSHSAAMKTAVFSRIHPHTRRK
jgi:hypothetical protein